MQFSLLRNIPLENFTTCQFTYGQKYIYLVNSCRQVLSRKRQYVNSSCQHKLGSYHVSCRAILIALKTLQGHPAYRSVLVITETMVILREEISSQGSVSQSHAKAARLDQTISGSDIPEKGIIDFKADRIDIYLTITMIDELLTP